MKLAPGVPMSWLLVVLLLAECTYSFYFEGEEVDMCGVDRCMAWPAQLTNSECDKLLQCLSSTSIAPCEDYEALYLRYIQYEIQDLALCV